MLIRLMAASAAAVVAGCFGGSVAQARFLQVDPVGYKDQVNLYAYVNNDPIDGVDPTGTTCTGSESNGKTTYSCHIDSVAVQGKDGKWTTRPPTAAENKKFAGFNARYTAAINRLAANPNRSVTVAAVLPNGLGSFKETAGQQVTGRVEGARTFVHDFGLSNAHESGIVHDGGMHATYPEFTGGLQNGSLSNYDHWWQYNHAACNLLGGRDCAR